MHRAGEMGSSQGAVRTERTDSLVVSLAGTAAERIILGATRSGPPAISHPDRAGCAAKHEPLIVCVEQEVNTAPRVRGGGPCLAAAMMA